MSNDKYAKYAKQVSYSSNGRGAIRTSESTSHVEKDGCLGSFILMLSIPAGLLVLGVSYFL